MRLLLEEGQAMSDTVLRSADERRREIQDRALALGIDDAYVSLLVDTFYERVRAQPLLGPIFEQVVVGDWAPHLAKMKDFWASVAFNAGRYSGRPVPVHQALSHVEPWHFKLWLALFRQTLIDTAPTPGAVDHFMERAERIAQSLQLAMFGADGLPAMTSRPARLPAGAVKYAETPVFTEASTPDKLRGAHDTKAGVWGKLVVAEGALDYVVIGPPERRTRIRAGECAIIEPKVLHRVDLNGPVQFRVEFWREAADVQQQDEERS
jgi:hemoglobin